MSLLTPSSMTPDSRIFVLARDLILASRISATARAAGIALVMLRDVVKLADVPRSAAQQTLIVDLNQDGALDAAIAWRAGGTSAAMLTPTPSRVVVGFVAHTDADTIRRAREGGIDRVLPRSKFVEELETILEHAANGDSSHPP